jgi:hypothetical protein
MKQPQDKGTSAWPVLDTLQTSDFLLVGLLSQLQEITIHFHRPLKDRLTQNRTTRVHNQVWALAVCRWFEFEGYLGLTTGNFHMGTSSDPGALVNTKTGKWRFNPQKTCDETLDPFWSIPICAMVKTWLAMVIHPIMGILILFYVEDVNCNRCMLANEKNLCF